jgi:hypothetical protein
MTARLLLVLWLLPGWLLQAAAHGTLAEHYYASRCSRFSGASADELVMAQDVFEQALRGAALASPALATAWRRLGFDWFELQEAGGPWWVARERQADCRGRGFYVFSTHPEADTVLQVPHRFKDTGTGLIALKMAHAPPFRALAWNTAPRVIDADGQSQDADLAHRWDGYFVALTRAFAATLPQGRLVQLHGFASARRSSAQAANADIIVSAGTRWPSVAARAVSDCLRAQFPDGVRLFPRDVGELGATRNLQGRLLRSLGHNGFVHLELSDALRARLAKAERLRTQLCQCLESAP